MASRKEKIEYLLCLQERINRRARRNLLDFTKTTMPNFEPIDFHKHYYDFLTDFAHGRIKKGMVFIPPQHGKALKVDTPILTTNGWKKHCDLRPGDYVFGDKGRPVRVLKNHGSHINESAIIHFSGGENLTASIQHEWLIECDREKYRGTGRQVEIIETQDLLIGQRRNPAINAAIAIELPERILPIKPYVLGCWLGDGAARQGVLTVGKEDINHFSKLGETREVKPGIYRVLIEGLSKQLRENSLILNKHIPIEYLLSSRSQRLELLRGLMDTDGCIDDRGRCEFTQKENGLADDVFTLLRSLGIKPTRAKYPMKLNGKTVGIKDRIFFSKPTIPVFNLKRKRDSQQYEQRIDSTRYFIESVQDIGLCEVNCISVEGGLYLAGEQLILTHNSEGSTRRLPAFKLGLNPNTKIAIISYSAPKARKFNREIQRVINTDAYHLIFPETNLNSSLVTTISESWLRNADECEIVGFRGGFKTVGVGGPLTGDPVDMLIMDDIYKDAKSAWSATVRESIDDWYDTVAETRLHNDSQQLIVFTRWHENDLAGRLLEQQGYFSDDNPNGWVVIVYKAFKTGNPTEYDGRQEGEALWPERHSHEKLELIRLRNPHVFESLYQQDPKPVEGLMYENPFKEYEVIPHSARMIRKNYTDTADEGKDFLCSINYVETESANYILDVLYTSRPMEYTEPKTAEMLSKHNIQEAVVESNNGGRSFAREVEKQCRALGNNKTRFKWFHQKDNKAIRIFTKSAAVQNLTYVPKGWERMWPDFYRAITSYMKVGKNEHDDAPDALTGTVEKRGKGGKQDLSGLFG